MSTTIEAAICFSEETLSELRKPLDKRLVSEREGGGKKKLSYIEGHVAIDQANRIFGSGNWGYDLLYCRMEVLKDPVTDEAIGIAYKAAIRLTVRDCIPVTDVGSQPVAAWNVQDVIMGRRKQGDESPIKAWEVAAAKRTIAESHEQSEKGAVTDAMKRALRTFGSQFANDLYGDGSKVLPLDVVADEQSANGNGNGISQSHAQALHDLATPGSYEQHHGEEPATDQQLASIGKLCQHLGKPVPAVATYIEAKALLLSLSKEYNEARRRKGAA
jgi:recombination DNA repair RAD52 pathway protein